MSGTTSKARAAALARVQALIAGTQLHFPTATITLGNTAFTTASLLQELQRLEPAVRRVEAAQAGAKDAVKALRETVATLAPLLRDYRRFLLATFSTATQTLADFGLQPPKAPKPLPTEKRATATAKMRATRKARGTTSRKKKLAVKGDVTGVVVTPVTEPGHASPTQPASNASSAPTAAPAK
jgi:hypothetical protein